MIIIENDLSLSFFVLVGILAAGGLLLFCGMVCVLLLSRRRKKKAANAHNYRYTQV